MWRNSAVTGFHNVSVIALITCLLVACGSDKASESQGNDIDSVTLESNINEVATNNEGGTADRAAQINSNNYDLHDAAKKGEVDTLLDIINDEVDVNKVDQEGWTALHYAVLTGKFECVKVLVNNGADENIVNKRGDSALDMSKRYPEIYEYLRPKYTMSNNLRSAGQRGDVDKVKLILADGVDINGKNKAGYTVLRYMVTGSSSTSDKLNAVTEILLKNGANAKETLEDKRTLLHLAAQMGFAGRAKLLIRYGAEVNCIDDRGKTPLHHANSSCDVIKTLVENGADINAKDNKGHTPLHRAARAVANSDGILCLINEGGDITARSNDGRTPIWGGGIENRIDSVQTLMDAGADLQIKDKYGNTVSDYVKENGSNNMVELFVTNGLI